MIPAKLCSVFLLIPFSSCWFFLSHSGFGCTSFPCRLLVFWSIMRFIWKSKLRLLAVIIDAQFMCHLNFDILFKHSTQSGVNLGCIHTCTLHTYDMFVSGALIFCIYTSSGSLWAVRCVLLNVCRMYAFYLLIYLSGPMCSGLARSEHIHNRFLPSVL